MRTWKIALAAGLAAAGTAAAADSGVSPFIVRGTIGPYRVGAMLAVAPDHVTVGTAHYFYVSKLTDIPLQVQDANGTVTMREPGGATFTLHFVGNGSEKGAPLDFNNSVGLAGVWRSGATQLPVKLQFDGINTGADPAHWYAQVTQAPDAQFEAIVRRFLHGATTGNMAEAASATHFPLRVNGAHPYRIANAAQLKARWASIFTPAYVAKLKQAVPHEMFVHEGEAMVGSGEAWFDADGATGLNVG